MDILIRQRIKEVFNYYKTNPTAFANGDSALQRRLNRQINENASITLETINIILDRFSNLSSEWLLSGKGSMLNEDPKNAYLGGNFGNYNMVGISNTDYAKMEVASNDIESKDYLAEISDLKDEMKLLKEENRELRQTVIELLKKIK